MCWGLVEGGVDGVRRMSGNKVWGRGGRGALFLFLVLICSYSNGQPWISYEENEARPWTEISPDSIFSPWRNEFVANHLKHFPQLGRCWPGGFVLVKITTGYPGRSEPVIDDNKGLNKLKVKIRLTEDSLGVYYVITCNCSQFGLELPVVSGEMVNNLPHGSFYHYDWWLKSESQIPFPTLRDQWSFRDGSLHGKTINYQGKSFQSVTLYEHGKKIRTRYFAFGLRCSRNLWYRLAF